MQSVSLPAPLQHVLGTTDLTPITGLPFPIESTILFPVHKGTGKLIMSFTTRNNKKDDGTVEVKQEWALVGGKAESQLKGEQGWTDFSDKRFIKDGRQFTAEECAAFTFENPRVCLGREAVEELTGQKGSLTPESKAQFSWVTDKIQKSPFWTCVKSSRDVVLDKEKDIKVKGYSTYTCLCKVEFSDEELNKLNNDIVAYEKREHRFFKPHSWSVKPVQVKDKPVTHLVVDIDGEGDVRNYNKNIMFKFYHDEISTLLSRKN